jgi:hypothetical protein
MAIAKSVTALAALAIGGSIGGSAVIGALEPGLRSTPLALAADGEAAGPIYALARGFVRVQVTGTLDPAKPDTSELKVTLTPVIRADPMARYQLALPASRFFGTSTSVEISAEGLLAKLNSATENPTEAIASELTSVAVAVGPFVHKGAEAGPAVPRRFSVDALVDPFDQSQIDQLNQALADAAGIRFAPSDGRTSTTGATAPETVGGVVYRPLTDVVATIDQLDGNTPMPERRQRVDLRLPDPHAILALPMSRALCARREVDVTFHSGAPAAVKLTAPSDAASCVAAPSAIFKSLLGFVVPPT